MVLTNLAPDFFGIKNHCTTEHLVQNRLVSVKLLWTKLKKKNIPKLCRTKRNRINGYLEQRQVKILTVNCESWPCLMPRKLNRHVPGYLLQFQPNTTKMCPAYAAVSGFTFFFHPTGWTTLVVRVISHGQFHCRNRGHTMKNQTCYKSHFLVGKRSSGMLKKTSNGAAGCHSESFK